MKPEELFGINAGKVWHVLKENEKLTANAIAKKTGLKLRDVYGALGWLGREGKIEILEERGRRFFRLLE